MNSNILYKTKTPSHSARGSTFTTWRCPTLTWGSPTLPSALQHFTSEFGMESGRTTALWSPEYPVMIHLIILPILLLKTKNKPQNLSFPPKNT